MIWESIKTVCKEFKLNKMRTFLTMLGIIVGIFSITMIFALSNATKSYMNTSLSAIGTELTSYNVMTNTNLESEFIEMDLDEYSKNSSIVNRMSKVKDFSFDEYESILELKNDNEYYDSSYLAVDENYMDINNSSLKESDIIYGRFLSKKDIINKMPFAVLRDDTAIDLFGTSNVVGRKITIGNNELEIIGILKNKETALFDSSFANVFVSYYYAKEYMDVLPYTSFYFSPKNNNYTKEMKKEIKNIIEQYISSDSYTSLTADLDLLMDAIDSIVQIVELVFIGIASLSIIVGGIGIMNIMLVSVSERIKETGIRMALGAKNSDIVIQFLIEGIMFTLLSGIIGIILAYLLSIGVNFVVSSYTSYDFILSIDIITMLKVIVFCGLIGILFGIYPALKAGKLDPVEALKYE